MPRRAGEPGSATIEGVPLLQVLLILAILGVIAVVAAGRGDRLRQPATDLPDLALPDRRLIGADVDGVTFSLALRGYRQDEVDAALDRLAEALRERDERIALLQAQLGDSGAPMPWPANDEEVTEGVQQ